MAGYLGSGDLYFNRVVGGVEQGWLPFGNATKFEIKEASDIKQRISKQKNSYGNVLDLAPVKQPAEIAITLDDLNKDNLAIAFLGDISAVDITGASATDEGHGTNAYDSIIRLDNEFVSNVVITDSATGVITYALDVDYVIVSADRGLIKIIEGDATDDIVENEVYVDGTSGLKISYDYASTTSNKVKGGTNASVKVALLLDGENFADQSKATVDVWDALLTPQSGVDFLSDEFVTLELTGQLNKPADKPSAYEVNTDKVSV